MSISEIMKALESSKINAPKKWEESESIEDSSWMSVIEMEFEEKPLSEHLDIEKRQFPLEHQLEDDEIREIVYKILDTWSAYNYHADLPEGLPIRKAYEVLLSVWDDTVARFPFGNYHFDFYDRDLESSKS